MPKKHTLEKRLAVVLAGLRAEDNIREICKEHGVEVKSYYRWTQPFGYGKSLHAPLGMQAPFQCSCQPKSCPPCSSKR